MVALERYDIGITERFAALENRLLRLEKRLKSSRPNRRLARPQTSFQLIRFCAGPAGDAEAADLPGAHRLAGTLGVRRFALLPLRGQHRG